MKHLKSSHGFTLIELLVVIAIIGVLAAIAIPQFAAYRRRSFEAQVKSDLHNAAVAQEAYYVTSNTYKACTACTGAQFLGFNATARVTIDSSGGMTTFVLTGHHASCAPTDTWTYASLGGTVAGGPCN